MIGFLIRISIVIICGYFLVSIFKFSYYHTGSLAMMVVWAFGVVMSLMLLFWFVYVVLLPVLFYLHIFILFVIVFVVNFIMLQNYTIKPYFNKAYNGWYTKYVKVFGDEMNPYADGDW